MQTAKSLDFSTLKDGDTGTINPALIDDFRFENQRGERSQKGFDELVSSVKKHGIITPLTLWRSQNGDNRLEVLGGHGRRDAAIENKLTSVPFVFRDVTPEQAFAMHVSENEDRENVGFVARSKAVMRYMTEFKGDVEAVASQLNMTVKKCRELIEINKCSDSVKKAITEGHITPSHAIILAPFPQAAQDKNLPTIIAEKWTVSTLRQRVGKAKLPLERAVFDKSECENCEFNSIHQRGLFESTDSNAQCAKPACFQAKTTAHMESKKAQLTEEYGHILLLSQTNADDRNTVSAEVVGDAQFETCTTCDNRIAVLSDAWGKAGEITPNQCVDKTCFTQCTSAMAKEVKAQQKVLSEKGEGNSEQKAKSAAKQSAKTAKKAQLPNVVAEHYKKLLRKAASEFYADDDNFIGALLTSALVSHAQLTFKNSTTGRFADVLPQVLGMSKEERQELVKTATVELLTKTTTDSDNGNITDTLINCMKTDSERALPFVTEFWMPTDDNLNVYTKQLLTSLSTAAGVKLTLDKHNKGDFTKLSKQSKPDFIKGIQATNVDWKNYAPKSFTALIGN